MSKPTGSRVAPWGTQTVLEYKRGFLIGALMLDGRWDGFNPTPLILLRGLNTRAQAHYLASLCLDVREKQRLLPNPAVLEYARGGFGIECVGLEDISSNYLTLVDRLPSGAFFTASSKFYSGVVAAAIELYGIVNPASITITLKGSHPVSVIGEILTRLGVPASTNQAGISIRGKYAINNLLEWLPDSSLSEHFQRFNSPGGHS